MARSNIDQGGQRGLVAVLAALCLGVTAVAGRVVPGDAPVVRCPDGQELRLEAPKGGVMALVFYSTECPIANQYNPTLNALAEGFAGDRFRLVGLCVDPDLSDPQVAAHAKEYQLAFPVGRDRGLDLARRFGIKVTPEAVVLDGEGRVRYRGRIDDQFAGRSKKNKNPQTHELRDAIEAVLAGRKVERPDVPAVGCPLPEVAGR